MKNGDLKEKRDRIGEWEGDPKLTLVSVGNLLGKPRYEDGAGNPRELGSGHVNRFPVRFRPVLMLAPFVVFTLVVEFLAVFFGHFPQTVLVMFLVSFSAIIVIAAVGTILLLR